jgi:hypothetical protein
MCLGGPWFPRPRAVALPPLYPFSLRPALDIPALTRGTILGSPSTEINTLQRTNLQPKRAHRGVTRLALWRHGGCPLARPLFTNEHAPTPRSTHSAHAIACADELPHPTIKPPPRAGRIDGNHRWKP